jgi:hypothetical protein
MINRKNIILAIAIILVLLGVFFGISYYSSLYQKIIVSSNESFSLKLYKIKSQGEGVVVDKNIFFETSKPGSYRLRKGFYRYILSKQKPDYIDKTSDIKLDKDKVVIKAGDFSFTEEKLKSMLLNEESTINELIKQSYPIPMSSYTVQQPKLYYTGQWYGALLVPPNTDEQDTYRIVLKKDNGKWLIVTKPPDILLAKPVFPDVPFNILSDLNNKGSY